MHNGQQLGRTIRSSQTSSQTCCLHGVMRAGRALKENTTMAAPTHIQVASNLENKELQGSTDVGRFYLSLSC